MRNLYKRLAVLLCISLLTACTTMEQVWSPTEGSVGMPESGSTIFVTDMQGESQKMKYTSLNETHLTATPDKTKEDVVIALTELEKIEWKKLDGLKTGLLVIGGGALLIGLGSAAAAPASILSVTP